MIEDSDPFATDADLTEEAEPLAPHEASAGFGQDVPSPDELRGAPEVSGALGSELPDPEDSEHGLDPEGGSAVAPAPADRKKGIPLWVWIMLGAVGFVAIAGGLAVLTMPKSPVREPVRAPVAMRPNPAPLAAAPISLPAAGSMLPGTTAPSRRAPPGPSATAFPSAPSGGALGIPAPPDAPPALPGSAAPPAPAPVALSMAPSAATTVSSGTGTETARTLTRILSRVKAMQSSLSRLRRLRAPGPSPAQVSDLARLRAEHERDEQIIRGLEAERAALRMQVLHLLRGPLYGWKVAGLSPTAVVLRNARGVLRVVRPGDRVADATVVSIDVAGRRVLTSRGPVRLPTN